MWNRIQIIHRRSALVAALGLLTSVGGFASEASADKDHKQWIYIHARGPATPEAPASPKSGKAGSPGAAEPAGRAVDQGSVKLAEAAPTISCAADFDGSGRLDIRDFIAFGQAFNARNVRADFNRDGRFDVSDYATLHAAFAAGCR